MTKQYGTLNPKMDFTEEKKRELDSLTNQVIDAQYEAAQLQATVISFSDKSQKILLCLAAAEADRTYTLNNKNLLDGVIENALTLRNNSQLVFGKMCYANVQKKILTKDAKALIDMLIYSAEMINKLSTLIHRKKALNPLISDELVSLVNTAGKDANNAVALTLVALKSTFAAQAASIESEATTTLEYTQAIKLYQVLTGDDNVKGDDKNLSTNAEDIKKLSTTSLKTLMYDAYINAKDNYDRLHKASNEIAKQLKIVIAKSNKAQIKVKSLQSGLAAATAAAYAA